MAKPEKKRGFTIPLPGFGSKKDQAPKQRAKKKAMPVEVVSIRFALLRRVRGDPELRTDLRRVEIQPEIKEKKDKAIAAGTRLSATEQNQWNTIVRYKIREITELRRAQIAKGSNEEQEVFAEVAQFARSLPPERQRLLQAKKTLARLVLTDLGPHRPRKDSS